MVREQRLDIGQVTFVGKKIVIEEDHDVRVGPSFVGVRRFLRGVPRTARCGGVVHVDVVDGGVADLTVALGERHAEGVDDSVGQGSLPFRQEPPVCPLSRSRRRYSAWWPAKRSPPCQFDPSHNKRVCRFTTPFSHGSSAVPLETLIVLPRDSLGKRFIGQEIHWAEQS